MKTVLYVGDMSVSEHTLPSNSEIDESAPNIVETNGLKELDLHALIMKFIEPYYEKKCHTTSILEKLHTTRKRVYTRFIYLQVSN